MPSRSAAVHVVRVVVEEDGGRGVDARELARELVDARVGFTHPDFAGVHHDGEQLDGERRPPGVAELTDVVREQREPDAARRGAGGSGARPPNGC